MNTNDQPLVKSDALFSFELEGRSSIDARNLSEILDNTVQLVQQAVQGEKGTYVNLEITKFATGSFDVDFQAIAEQAANLLRDPNNLASVIVATVIGAFKITKHLRGERPIEVKKENGKVSIKNKNGEVLLMDNHTANKYFQNASLENNTINIVNIVEADEKRGGFQVKGRDDSVIYDREDLKAVAPVVGEMLEETERVHVNTIQANLIIRKPDLIGKSKWGFIFDGNIDANIEDEEWLEKVRSENIKFGQGMQVPVQLKIEARIDRQGNVLPNPTYTVLKVTGEIVEGSKLDQIGLDI